MNCSARGALHSYYAQYLDDTGGAVTFGDLLQQQIDKSQDRGE